MEANIRNIIFSPWCIRIPINDRVRDKIADQFKGFYDIMVEQCSSPIIEQLGEDIKVESNVFEN